MHRATFSIPCGDERLAKAIYQAVSVEAADGPDGTTTELSLGDSGLDVAISARDASGLRAAVHGVLRLLDAAQRVAKH